MPAISHLNPTWGHTLTDILNHDPKTRMGIIMRAWVKDNNPGFLHKKYFLFSHLKLVLIFVKFETKYIFFWSYIRRNWRS